MSIKKNKKIKNFWKKYENKVILFLGVFLVAMISFQLGILQGQKWQQDPLVIEKVPDKYMTEFKSVLGESSENNSKKESLSVDNVGNDKSLEKNKECVLVGSKNSNKYHNMSCQWSSRIKAENRVCFKDAEGAKSKGYVPASCIK